MDLSLLNTPPCASSIMQDNTRHSLRSCLRSPDTFQVNVFSLYICMLLMLWSWKEDEWVCVRTWSNYGVVTWEVAQIMYAVPVRILCFFCIPSAMCSGSVTQRASAHRHFPSGFDPMATTPLPSLKTFAIDGMWRGVVNDMSDSHSLTVSILYQAGLHVIKQG